MGKLNVAYENAICNTEGWKLNIIKFLGIIFGKLIHKTFFVPIQFDQKSHCEPDRFLKIAEMTWDDLIIWPENWKVPKKFVCMSFPEIGLAHERKIEIKKKDDFSTKRSETKNCHMT